VNLTAFSYWADAWPFVDAMKHTDPWISGRPEHPDPNRRWDDGTRLPCDAHGWVQRLEPGQVARKIIFGQDTHFRPGRYTVLYQGKGQLEYRGSVTEIERSPGKDTFLLGPGSLLLELTQTDPTDPLRDVHILPGGGRCGTEGNRLCDSDAACGGARCETFVSTYKTRPFHPEFLADISSAKVLRFMDWMDTNRPGQPGEGEVVPPPRVEWSDWPTAEDAEYFPIPFDLIIALAKETNAEPWITIPHAASNDLVRRIAEKFARELPETLRLHVEYSNEVWNPGFGQFYFAAAQGCRRFAEKPTECDDDGDGVLCEPGPWTETMAACTKYGRRFHALRTAEVQRIFMQAFGAQASSRLVRVVAWQLGSMGDHEIELLRASVLGRPLSRWVDVFAVAPYFGVGIDHMPSADAFFARVDRETFGAPKGTFRILASSLDGNEPGTYAWLANDVKQLRELKDLSHLRLVAYEGGQHLFSFFDGEGPKIRALNEDPRMEAVYLDFLGHFSRLTDDGLFVHFQSPGGWWKHGTFGSKAWQGQPLSQTPKERALLKFAAGKTSK